MPVSGGDELKVLLLAPPIERNAPILESLSLGYIAAVLRRDGHEVEILSAGMSQLGPKDAIREVLVRDFDCLGITAVHSANAFITSAVRAVRSRKRNATIVVGGYLPTLSTEQFLTACPEVDVVVRGEGEEVAPDLFGRIARGEDWRNIPGIAFLEDGVPIITPLPLPTQDLDSLPFPARDTAGLLPAYSRVAIAGSRGCYHRCSFCSTKAFYELSGSRAPRFRSPANIVDEIESVIASTGLTRFVFLDEDFIGPGEKCRARAINVAEEMRARKLKIDFAFDCRADVIDEDLLRLLKEVGLTQVFLGIESGVQRQLDTFNKRITVEQNRRGIEMVRRLGLRLVPGFILFDPYTTAEELEENRRFIQETGLSENQDKVAPAHKILLYPGAPLVEKLREDGLLKENGIDLDYDFKDPRTRLIYGVVQALARCSQVMKRPKRPFGRRRIVP